MQRIYSENPPPFHMYNLPKLEACSEPCQIPEVDLFAIPVFNGFTSLTVFAKSSTSDAQQGSEFTFEKCCAKRVSCLRGSFILICIRCIGILVLATF